MKQFKKLTKRQTAILNAVASLGKAGNQELLQKIQEQFDTVSRVTLIRDLNVLLAGKFIKRSGRGRAALYEPVGTSLLQPFDADAYFQIETDMRIIQNEKIRFKKIERWDEIFQKRELQHIEILTRDFQNRLKTYGPMTIKKELERITIEFSWRSAHIEGNTYSLLDTERLIKEHREASGKTHEETVMILNHKTALEYIWRHAKYFRSISLRKIEEIHDLIVQGLGIEKGFRKRPVGIVGTRYRPFNNVYQIRETAENLCRLVNSLKNPFLKSCIGVAGLSYIQPFEDGNKRSSRLLGNAILLANGFCPLSYRSVDEGEYKKAIILFYEQHSLALFKKIFLEQYEFAVQNYFP